jgi:phenylpropionate dioxygenase-like ring-hydroxylating dioxygenase large terminal subunit
MTPVSNLEQLVAWQEGLVSPAIYFDEDLHRQEQERVFSGGWVPVGHEDMVRNPGDYVTNYIGEVPVIVVRNNGGDIRVLINRCRHRGNTVCLFDRGNAHNFNCSYHGWMYDLDGRLVGVPQERQLYGDGFDKNAWGLDEAPKVVNFKGLLFATLDRDAPVFDDWLGTDVRWWLETFVLAEPVGGLEALPGWHRYRSPGNWKFSAENFIGDNYHVPVTHTSWNRVARELRDRGSPAPMVTSPLPLRGKEEKYEVTAGYGRGCPLGIGALLTHGEALYERDLAEATQLGASAAAWVRDRHRRMEEALREYEPRPYGFVNGLLFPNLGLMGYASPMIGRHFLLFHPRGVAEHETWQWTMVEREAPDVVKELAAQRVYQGQHMAGVVAPDDVENFERIVEAMHAPRTWSLPLNFQAHLTDDLDQLPGLPGNVSAEPSEVNQRQFHRFWLELMSRDNATANGRW